MGHITKIGLAVVEDNRLLLVRKRHTRFYILPGGKPEHDEDDVTALIREVYEELGCSINRENLVFLGSFSDDAAGMTGVTVTVKLYAGTLTGIPSPSSEIEQLLWFRPEDRTQLALAPSLSNSIVPYLFSNPAPSDHARSVSTRSGALKETA
jgi:8-oxo-dGTP pyrophosphatase MutT (NUDIX family)